MSTYAANDAADPEAYDRLMRERYGPLAALDWESACPPPLSPAPPRHRKYSRRWPDPEAAQHRELLDLALRTRQQKMKASVIPEPDRTPPVPGAIWCNSCDSWCDPISNLCRCNDQ
ncbi:hypothetical protein [Kitasatospora cheerisanensis]|uniref:Uncharacterized protein n=1 Tax=Kitasatospora cheerisanensis KCTC 2395 TaxID=1348663 RepID=A0A066Z5M1_9ACTN|nr:hypothetical protein [Kitasatospora cheerisanensis]KDN85621.1 hypothetical protein KCH_26380 [Kitasatospora cheerisanensis KCTC 2395]